MQLTCETKPKIITAIPCFNTERSIRDVVSAAKKYVEAVIVIDDGSTDNTSMIAEAAGALVVKHERKRGAGAATKTGFELFRTLNADILVTLDGDGQHDPEDIPKLIKPILNGEADLVIGSRFLNRKVLIPLYRKFGIRVINFLYNFRARGKVSDSQSCFRAYSKKAVQNLNITENGFAFSVQLLIQARRKDTTIVEIPISCTYNSNSHSLNPVIHGVGVAFNVIRLRLRHE